MSRLIFAASFALSMWFVPIALSDATVALRHVRFGLNEEQLSAAYPKGWYVNDNRHHLLLETSPPGLEKAHSVGIPNDGASITIAVLSHFAEKNTKNYGSTGLDQLFADAFRPRGSAVLQSSRIFQTNAAGASRKIYEIFSVWPQLREERSLITMRWGFVVNGKAVSASLSYWSNGPTQDVQKRQFSKIIESIR